MPEAITIKSDPAPAMAPDQEQTPEGDIQVQGEEPLLAGKYKSVDDLVKGYKELVLNEKALDLGVACQE